MPLVLATGAARHAPARAMIDAGLSEAEAHSRFYLVDRDGLLVDGMSGLQSFQMPFAQQRDRISNWKLETPTRIGLADVISNAQPTVLIGTSGQPKTFTERIVRDMARHVRQPIIFPLSNPTDRSEATSAELDNWTEGRAVIGTGSPFPPLKRNGKAFHPDQTNNAYVYPGIGLGALAADSQRISDGMFLAAAHAVAEVSMIHLRLSPSSRLGYRCFMAALLLLATVLWSLRRRARDIEVIP